MSRPLKARCRVDADPLEAAARFAADPATWLPGPARVHDVGQWLVSLEAGPLARPVACAVGSLWRVGDTVWRSLVWRPVAERDDLAPVARTLPTFRGELGLRPGESGVVLELKGVYDPPAGRLGHAADAAALRRVAVGTADRFLASVRARLEEEARSGQE